ncbi:MAG TPA: sigma-70 family RNA polymerase sigma factor [Thermoanaerobaculia bacterium]|nr:sigma-70 family RNA polymerase sigma factor [Thermoanaerobaculia bacterium]
MQAQDAEVVDLYLKGEAKAVGIVDGWITRAAFPYQRRLATRWDDVLQNIRLEVTRLLRQGKFRGESSFKTYLWRVVSHTCLDEIRAESRVKWTELESGDDSEEITLPHSMLGGPAPGARSEVKDLLLRVLERVPAECRELWRMIHAGLSYREMSSRLGVAEGTLRVRVLRCREKAVAARSELVPGAAV